MGGVEAAGKMNTAEAPPLRAGEPRGTDMRSPVREWYQVRTSPARRSGADGESGCRWVGMACSWGTAPPRTLRFSSCVARLGVARLGEEWLGTAWHGLAWRGLVGLGEARRVEVRRSMARLGEARLGWARHGTARHGTEVREIS